MTKLTKRSVNAAKVHDKDYFIWDEELPSFGLRVFTFGRRSYVIQYRARGRSRRLIIGKQGAWTAETAGRAAKVLLGKVARSGNRRVKDLTTADINRAMKDIMAGKARVSVETSKLRGRSIVRGGAGTAARTIGLLGGILTCAVDLGVIDRNPAAQGSGENPSPK